MINQIIELPLKFYSSDNDMSIYQLLQETGYFKEHDSIREKEILKSLNKSENLINHWLDWSANKRTASGWYFTKENDRYSVGYFDDSNKVNEKEEFSDAKRACAYFIKKEIESIRKS